MLRLSIILSTLVCSLASAQTNLLTIDTLWIHKANSNDEDMDSYFPILSSPNKPTIAYNVNTALQMQALGYILTSEKKGDLLRQPQNPFQRTNISFAFKRMTDRFFYIDIQTWHFINSMSLNGWNQTHRYYFDATSGQPVFLHEVFFNRQTLNSQMETVGSGLKESMVKVMKRYNTDFLPDDINELDQECQCNCSIMMHNAYRDGKARLDYNEDSKIFGFSMEDCDWMNPRSHDIYETSLRKGEADTWLTPYGKYLIYGGAPVVNDSNFKMWKGMIDGKIPVTFFFWVDNIKANEGHGLEIYDRHGISILIDIKVALDNSIEIDELDNNRKIIATISVKKRTGNLEGKWVKADGSKQLSFAATPAK